MNISLQLWSVKSEIEKNFKEAIEKVKQIGYNGVEFAGYGGLSAIEMKTLLDKNALYSVGSHTSFCIFETSFEEELEYHKQLNSEYIICPGMEMETEEDVRYVAKVLNKAGDLAEKYGIRVGYHNHYKEFKKVNDVYILDMLVNNLNHNAVLELDVFWAQYTGVDPYDYIEKWKEKIGLIHLKQCDKNNNNVDMPDGVIDMKRVISTAKYATHFIVEQEQFDKPVWDSLKSDFDYFS